MAHVRGSVSREHWLQRKRSSKVSTKKVADHDTLRLNYFPCWPASISSATVASINSLESLVGLFGIPYSREFFGACLLRFRWVILIDEAVIPIPEILHCPDRHVRANWQCPTQIPSIRNPFYLVEPQIDAISVQCLLGCLQVLHKRQDHLSKGYEVRSALADFFIGALFTDWLCVVIDA